MNTYSADMPRQNRNGSHPQPNRLMIGAIIIAVLAYFLVSFPASAGDGLVLSNESGKVILGPHLEILEDKTGKLTIGQVTSGALIDRFRPNLASKLNLGFTASAWWVRFRATPLNQEWLLEVAKANLDQVDVYIPTVWGQITHLTGDLRPPENRDLRSRTFVFRLPKDYVADQYIYLRLKSHTSLNLNLNLWPFKDWQDWTSRELVIFSLLLGTILVMAVYNLFIYLVLGDKTYIYYVLYMSTQAFYQIRLFGISSVLVDLPAGAGPPLTWALLSLSMIGGVLFSRSFLDTKANAPRLDKILFIIGILGLLVGVLGLTGQYRAANFLSHLTGFFAPIAFLTVGIVCLRKGFKPARYYLLAWIILLFSIMLFVIGGTIIPSSFITFHAILFGSVLEAILLSFALASRISMLQAERRTFESQTQQLTEMSLTDPLTGLFNRRYLLDHLADEVNKAHRLGQPLSVVMLDVDNFKNFNDTYGHPEGDKVLVKMAEVIRTCIREYDGPCRYGGEEFTIVLPHTKTENAHHVAERIRLMFSNEAFTPTGHDEQVSMTVSLGLTELKANEQAGDLITRADEALYKAKKDGKNRVKVA